MSDLNKVSRAPYPDPTDRSGSFSLVFYDNLHILLWLLKDTFWLLEWKWAGIFMVIPTVGVALILAFKTIKKTSLWLNLSILFWISANSYWMICEFLDKEHLKLFALVPFILGLISITLFYLIKSRK